jgi:hypothetical protein
MTNKHWYQSKTIWGIAIAFFGFLINQILKVDIQVPTNADYDSLYRHYLNLKENQDSATSLIAEMMSVVGTFLAIYGRVKADTEIKTIIK